MPQQEPATPGNPGNSRLAPGNLVPPAGPPNSSSAQPLGSPGAEESVPPSFSPGANPYQSSLPPSAGLPLPISPKPPRQWKKLALIPAGLLSLAVVAAAAWFVFFKPENPDALFRESLEKALSTKSLEASTVEEDSSFKYTSVTKMDISNVKEPKLSGATTYEYDTQKSSDEYYATKSNVFLKTSDATLLGYSESVNNKWLQAVKDGQTGGYAYGILGSTSTSWTFLGYFIHGNFEGADREELLKHIQEKEVYEYKADEVKGREIDGRSYFVYDIDVDEKELRELNKLAAKKMGINESDLDSIYALSSSDIKIKLYIDRGQKRIAIAEVDDSGIKFSAKFTGFDKTALPAEPKPEVSYEELETLTALPDETPGETFGSTPADVERKTDINALHGQIEAFYAQYGAYPTLANINDPNWRSQNMKGLDNEALKDPKGSSTTIVGTPKVGAYSYVAEPANCDNLTGFESNGDCYAYTLTAILDDGGTYVKTSLN